MLRKRPSEVSIEVLDPEHYHALVKAIRNILSTELAELSIAQLIDGLPLMISVFESRGCLIGKGHPLLEHETLYDGALQQAKQLRDGFDPAVLSFSSKVCTLSRLRFETCMVIETNIPDRSCKHIKAQKSGLENSRCDWWN